MHALTKFSSPRQLAHRSATLWLFAVLLAACTAGNGIGIISAATPTATLTVTPAPPTETPIPAAALVNGEVIPLEEFTAEMARFQSAQTALGQTPAEADAKRTVLDDLVSQVLLAQGAAEAGYTVEDAALQARIDALSAQIGGADKLSAWQQAHGYSEAAFKVALKRGMAAAWMRDKITSAVPLNAPQVHIRQILLYNEAVAQNYADQLKAGADFDQLAAQVDPVTRGDIGWFPRGYLAEKTVEEAAFSLEAGATSAIIHSEVGYHLLKLLETSPDHPLNPDALLTMQTRALNDWLDNRRQQSTILSQIN